jgi:mannose/fructose-specific phosphotransferase system component IIA
MSETTPVPAPTPEPASEPSPTPTLVEARGLVVTHGALGEALVDAVRAIAGAQADSLIPLSNRGCGPDELRERILAAIGPSDPFVVFTDLGAGSCTLAARLSCRDRQRVLVLTGVNLPMLLDFVFHRGLPLGELAERLPAKARESVQPLSVS